MNRICLSLLIVAWYSININGQVINREDLYFAKVKQFYNLLNADVASIKDSYNLFGVYAIELEEHLYFESDSEQVSNSDFSQRVKFPEKYPSLIMEKLKTCKHLFLDTNKLYSLDSLIENSNIYDDGSVSSIGIDLRFNTEWVVYFYLNRYQDEEVYITNIFLSNGESFYSKVFDGKKRYLYRYGTINDPDNYTNVRSHGTNDSHIVGRFTTDDTFLYSPNCFSNWWRVKSENGNIEGFMHKSRINSMVTILNIEKKQ